MMHDHSLGQRLCEQILQADDFAFSGLISSFSQRRNLDNRMRRTGIDVNEIAHITRPIGTDGTGSRQLARIAISVVAEILQVYDRTLQKRQYNNRAVEQREG